MGQLLLLRSTANDEKREEPNGCHGGLFFKLGVQARIARSISSGSSSMPRRTTNLTKVITKGRAAELQHEL